MSNFPIVNQLEHVGIAAKDTTSLAQWYCEIFGLDIVYKTTDASPIYFLGHFNTNFKLEIFPLESPQIFEETGVHISFKVPDLEKIISYLINKGIECSPIKHLMKNGKTVFFKDPVGHMLQVVERPVALWEE